MLWQNRRKIGYDLEGDTLPRNESSKDERSVFQEERSSPRFQINFLNSAKRQVSEEKRE